jgi:undecaprenyl-diphosphatase
VIVLAWAGLTAILVAAGEGVMHSSALMGFDRHVTEVVVAHRTSALSGVMKAVTWLGSWVAVLVTGVAIVYLTARRRLPIVALILAVVAEGGAAGGETLTKQLVQRHRPPESLWLVKAHGWSFPSGHTTTAVVVFTALAVVVTFLVRKPVVRALAWVTAVFAVAVTGFSRLELGVHWATDVIASVLFATGWLLVMIAALASTLPRPDPSYDDPD